jgi:DNA-directed RNA polymerase beta' subunit
MSENSIVSLSSIEYIKFGFNGDAENNINGVEINNYELFQPDGMPIPNGVYDLKMGTIDHNYLCSTCLNGKKLCPGHRGKYALKTSVLQPLGISLIRKILKIICFYCGSIVVESEKFENIPIHKRFNEILALAKEKKACPTCKTIHPKIVKTKDDYFTIYAEYQQEDKRKNTSIVGDKLYPGAIREIFNKISPATLEALNLVDGRNPLKFEAKLERKELELFMKIDRIFK